eukprot:jgi/Chlat1/1069/Chrsp110S08634
MEPEYSRDVSVAHVLSPSSTVRRTSPRRTGFEHEAPAAMAPFERGERDSADWSMPDVRPGIEPEPNPPERHQHECMCCGSKSINPLQDERTDELCSEFSMHGLPRAMRIDTSKTRRFLWLLVFLGGVAAFIALSIIQIQIYADFNTNININIVDMSRNGVGLRFPSITIWNVNTVRRSAVVDTPDYDEVCSTTAGLSGDMNEGFQRYPLNWTDEDVLASAHQLDSMLVGCRFYGTNCTASDFYTSISPFPDNRFGVAYTFNIFSNMTTYISGPDGGLWLALFIDQAEYCPRTWGSGMFFELHDHQGLPVDFAIEHISPPSRQMLANGRWWQVGITPTYQSFLGPPYNEPCVDLSKGQLIPRKNVSLECSLGCPGVDAYPINALAKFNREDFLSISSDSKCILDCFNLTLYQLCASTMFETETGSIEIPTINAVPAFMRRWPSLALGYNPDNITDDPVALQSVINNFHNNLVLISFYYKDISSVTQQIQTKAYTIGALISNVGGLTGLFLGMSVLTLVEAAEILALLCLIYSHDYQLNRRGPLRYQAHLTPRASSEMRNLQPFPSRRASYDKYLHTRNQRRPLHADGDGSSAPSQASKASVSQSIHEDGALSV